MSAQAHSGSTDGTTGERRERVLVFGATGFVGSNLVPYLVRAGLQVRAEGRSVVVMEAKAWAGVELLEADALWPETLDAALAGMDVAYYLVHSMAAAATSAGSTERPPTILQRPLQRQGCAASSISADSFRTTLDLNI